MAGYIGGSQPVAYITDSVDNDSLADDAVNSAEIADGAVDLAHMSVNSIGEHQYVDGSIDTIHIADNAITSAKIGVDVIVAADLAANSITVSELSDNAVTSDKIIADAVTAAKIGDDVINSEHIAAGAVDLEHMSSDSVDEDNLKISNSPTNGQFLSAQSGNTGGMTWAAVDALPSQSGNSGKFLTTDATDASWAVLDTDANKTTKGLYEMANAIASNYTIATNYNAVSAGPITVNNGVSVTVPSGSTWVIV